mmetsp:Transcript_5685/g.13360  ORF Transcript_5685/g.13360 Transcript_5685/m.13360 type:complete len:92 (-) Transcript_5685:98-373(-)
MSMCATLTFRLVEPPPAPAYDPHLGSSAAVEFRVQCLTRLGQPRLADLLENPQSSCSSQTTTSTKEIRFFPFLVAIFIFPTSSFIACFSAP